jgi:hypothetical protein
MRTVWWLALLLGLLGPVLPAGQARAEIECTTNCARECGSCTKSLGTTVCAPSRESCYKACLKEQNLMCLLVAAEKVGLVYGRYCGLGNKSGQPIDALDAACKAHDRCWSRRGQFACSCDKQLVNRTAKIAQNGPGSTSVRRKADLISDFFKEIDCLPG